MQDEAKQDKTLRADAGMGISTHKSENHLRQNKTERSMSSNFPYALK